MRGVHFATTAADDAGFSYGKPYLAPERSADGATSPREGGSDGARCAGRPQTPVPTHAAPATALPTRRPARAGRTGARCAGRPQATSPPYRAPTARTAPGLAANPRQPATGPQPTCTAPRGGRTALDAPDPGTRLRAALEAEPRPAWRLVSRVSAGACLAGNVACGLPAVSDLLTELTCRSGPSCLAARTVEWHGD